ncbi:MAG: type II toxin-antitoxin system VapC family toxin [Fimbriiglobus sp.]
MRGLLDTHTFIWTAEDSDKLSEAARAFQSDPSNTILVSTISVWEIVIKSGLGKLSLERPIEAILSGLPGAEITVIPFTLEHALAVGSLPTAHRDPFDRALAAQAIVEGAALLTADEIFRQYPVTVVW